jgi:MBG domain (YGX type)
MGSRIDEMPTMYSQPYRQIINDQGPALASLISVKSSFRRVPVSLALVMAGILFFALAGCGSNSAPVTTRPTLTFTAANASRVYGAANPLFTASASGALSGDIFTLTTSTVATPSSPAGAYSIVPVATGANLAN